MSQYGWMATGRLDEAAPLRKSAEEVREYVAAAHWAASGIVESASRDRPDGTPMPTEEAERRLNRAVMMRALGDELVEQLLKMQATAARIRALADGHED